MLSKRQLLIATKHGKERVIAPILEKEVGVHCFVAESFDTDLLGTFTGEIERKSDALTTARQKCKLAMEMYNCDLALASEGSFGPHPTMYFTPADDELLVLIDRKNDLEVIVRELSTYTNFNSEQIKSEQQLRDFAEKAKFPSHGIILKNRIDDPTDVVKGLTDYTTLIDTYQQFILKYGNAIVETDMRAMYNPTRMAIIEKAARKLAHKINSYCPNCKTPGFGITDAKPGLRCMQCDFPTRSTLSYIYSCRKCDFTKEELYPNNKTFEDPTYCDICNP